MAVPGTAKTGLVGSIQLLNQSIWNFARYLVDDREGGVRILVIRCYPLEIDARQKSSDRGGCDSSIIMPVLWFQSCASAPCKPYESTLSHDIRLKPNAYLYDYILISLSSKSKSGTHRVIQTSAMYVNINHRSPFHHPSRQPDLGQKDQHHQTAEAKSAAFCVGRQTQRVLLRDCCPNIST